MSRPLVFTTLAIALGIVLADSIFYQNLMVPTWLNAALWGFSLSMALGAWLCWPADGRSWINRLLFPLFVFLFFATFGFARYTSFAEEVQQSWLRMERPPVNRGNPDEFDYVRWRWLQGVEDSTTWTARLKQKALAVRSHLLNQYAAADMDDEAQAIVAAVTLGDRSQLSHETRDLYAAAGASHLLALSGMHLTIIVGFFLTLMNGRLLLSRWRPWLGIALIAFIWTYAFVAGLPTSLVRASLMTSLFVISALTHRYCSSLHLLVLTAFVMLLIRPAYLFDVGAQLSFAAVAGIVVLHRRWYIWFFERYRFQCFTLERYHLLWPLDILLVSLAAQLFTLPLVAYYFHRIPLYAPFFNLIFIPLTTVLIYVALTSLALSSLSTLLGHLLSWLVTAQLAVMQFEVQLPGAVINDFWSRKAEPQVVVYNNWRCPALHVIAAPDRSWLLTPVPDSLPAGMRYISESFWRRRLTAEPMVLKERQAVAIESGFSAVMVDGKAQSATRTALGKHQGAHQPVTRVDLLWITKGFKGTRLDMLTRLYCPHLLVLDASLSPWQRTALKEEAAKAGWNVYDIAEQGALRLRL